MRRRGEFGMKPLKSVHIYAFITTVLWSLAYVLIRLGLEHFSVFPLGFLRYAVASVVLVAVCLITRQPLPHKKDIPWFLLSGSTGFFVFTLLYNLGAASTTAATSSVIIASVPVFTSLLSSVFFREKLAPQQWTATALEFAGILVITTYGAALSTNIGILWLLLSALSLSLYNIIQKKLTFTYSGLESTAYSIFIGTILLSVFARQSFAELVTAPVPQILYLSILGVFCSAIAYVSWSKAFEVAENTSQVSNYMFFTPFLTGIFEFIMLGELPHMSVWIGGLLIIVGAMLFNSVQT